MTAAVRDHVRVLAGAPVAEPTWHHAEVLRHEPAGDRYRRLTLRAPSIAAATRAGQFVMLTVARADESGPVLPRPMAVYRRDRSAGTIDIVYGVVGSGTRVLAGFAPGETVLVVGPLGRGFDVPPGTRRVLLAGRGIGTCSLTTVAQELAGSGTAVTALSSARTPAALVGAELYAECGAEVLPVTDATGDSDVAAVRAVLRDRLAADPPGVILTCGSDRLAWLCRQLATEWGAQLQVSLEAHMACGLGYCHGCASGSRGGPGETPLVCADGPVFHLPDPGVTA